MQKEKFKKLNLATICPNIIGSLDLAIIDIYCQGKGHTLCNLLSHQNIQSKNKLFT
jgi:DNA-directed RNA polymerase subunit L